MANIKVFKSLDNLHNYHQTKTYHCQIKVADLLKQTKRLSDGTFERIFSVSRSPVGDSVTYNCHLCESTGMPDEGALVSHAEKRIHQGKMYSDPPNAVQFRARVPKGTSIMQIKLLKLNN
jgi:hypothetical protein